MKFNYKHLLSHLEKKPTIDELSNTLFQLGHENEFKNEIFDLELTPNRGDCLSLLGIARDLNYFYGHLNNMKIYDGELDNFNFDFKNHQPSACPQISFLYLEIESICKNYCDYLQSYLDDLEINKVNFFTDISNYVSYELGQPSHCYDFLSLSGPIELNKLNGKKRFTTLLNEEIELNRAADFCLLSDPGVFLDTLSNLKKNNKWTLDTTWFEENKKKRKEWWSNKRVCACVFL